MHTTNINLSTFLLHLIIAICSFVYPALTFSRGKLSQLLQLVIKGNGQKYKESLQRYEGSYFLSLRGSLPHTDPHAPFESIFCISKRKFNRESKEGYGIGEQNLPI